LLLMAALRKCLILVAYPLAAAAVFDGPVLLLALGLGIAAFALTTRPRSPAEIPRYRLEHRYPGRMRVLAATSDEGTGHETLQRQAAQLTADGATGQLVLVDLATRRPINWLILGPPTTDRSVGTDT
jgi:hypothetical protein